VVSTYFALLSEYGTGEIPLREIAGKFFGVHDDREQKRRALLNKFPVPVYRGGGQRTQWLVSAKDLAEYIDQQRAAARTEWERSRSAAPDAEG
jgi:hypothetical protein